MTTIANHPQRNTLRMQLRENLLLMDMRLYLENDILVKLDRASKVKLLLTSRRDEQGWLGGIPYRVAIRAVQF